MSVVKLKRKRKRTPRDLVPLAKVSGAGRFFVKMVNEIRGDLGGRGQTTRVADELIEAFAGCATALRYQTHEILMGEADLDLTGYATLASTMLRIGTRLGLYPRKKTVPTMAEFLAERARVRGETPIEATVSEESGDPNDE